MIANLFWSHELNARLTNNVMALPQTVGFKAEAVDEEGAWCACTVEEVDDDYVHYLIGKESEETFPFSEQCLRFKKTEFHFPISPKLP